MTRPSVYELRNYTMQPGGRDVLIDLFEREFVETQEAVGARVVGTFRNLDDPNRFVWLRCFADIQARAAALDAFYTGSVWQAHRTAANATIVDSDDVLQLRPISGDALRAERPPIGTREIPDTLFVATTYFLRPDAEGDFASLFSREIAPLLIAADGASLATFATEHAPNSYPRLPVRENETVFVTLTPFANAAAYEERRAELNAAGADEIARHIIKPTEVLRLQPTPRSALR